MTLIGSFLFSMAESLIEQLASRAFVEACQMLGVYNDLQLFTQTLSYIKAVLLDAEQMQNQEKYNHELGNWLWRVRDVLSDAKNVLDEVECENLQKKVIKGHGSSNIMLITKVDNFFSSSNPLVFRFRMAHKMKQINTRLDKIAADRHKFGFKIVDADNRIVHRRDLTYSSVIDSEVIGREHDKEKIINFLIPRNNNKNLSVIPIVGLGGVGKTTLAKLVFNDERIGTYFPLKIWVCVSGSFDIKQVIIKIINSANDSSYVPACQQSFGDLDIQQLQNHLKNKLKGQMFLLVLDDVWNEDRVKWVEFRNLIQVGAAGSQLLVTTRNQSIASMMGTIPSHTLLGLSLEDSLSILVKWAFKEEEEKKYPHLVNIGKDIVKKCGGIPLAVRTLGSSLFSKYETDEWEYVRDSQIWNLPIRDSEDTNNILHALWLSYFQMPCYLKECFALFSLYPKDHAYDSFDIASLWRAHDLLPPPIRNQTLKYSANQFLFELLSISFIQDFTDYGIGFTFKIHDLVHSCAEKIACESAADSLPGRRGGITIPHMCFPENKGLDKFSFRRFKKLRSILFPTAGIGANSDTFLNACMSRCKQLRYLDLSDSTYNTLPRSMGKLKHLRYLSLENNRNIKRLPDSICNLLMLEMLILSGCTDLETLPKGLGKLISLQHLEITTKQSVLPEDEIANLSSLQTLRIEFCNNLESLLGGIKLPSLKVLCVSNCRNLKSLPLDIEHFPALETLLVDSCDILEIELLEGHKDQNSSMRLKVLTIVSMPQLVTLPRWLQGSANTLQYLSISSCNNLVALPPWLSTMNCLKTICITGCPNIMSLPTDIHHLATLERLEIDGYPELLKKSQQEVGESSQTQNTIDEPEEVVEELE